MSKPTAGFSGALVAVFAAASAGLCLLGAGSIDRSLPHGQLGPLFGGLGLFAAGLAVLALAGRLAWVQIDPWISRHGTTLDPDVILAAAVCIVFLAAETGLSWLFVQFSGMHHAGATLTAALTALVLLGAFVAGALAALEHGLGAALTFGAVIIVAEAAAGWLAIRLAWEDQAALAWLAVGLGLAALFPWLLIVGEVRYFGGQAAFVLLVPVASLGALTVSFANRGQVIGAAAAGVAALGSPVLLYRQPGVAAPLRLRRYRAGLRRPTTGAMDTGLGSGSRAVSSPPPEGVVPFPARLAGLVLPLAIVVWAVVRGGHDTGGVTAVRVFAGIAWLAAASVALFVVQTALIAWLSPAHLPELIEAAAASAQHDAAAYLDRHSRGQTGESARDAGRWWDPGSSAEWADPGPYERERHGYAPAGPYGRRWPDAGYPPEPERLLRDRAALRDEKGRRQAGERDQLARRWPRIIRFRPLGPGYSVALASLELAQDTGLNPDRVWPRLQLVIPPEAGRAAARRLRVIALLRVAAASSLSVALIWPLATAIVLVGAVTGGELTLFILTPLSVSVMTALMARRQVAGSYTRRIDAARIYRFDLARALRLPVPSNTAGFAALRKYIYPGSPANDQPVVWPEARDDRAASAGPDLAALRQALAADVSQLAVREIRDFLREQRGLLRGWLTETALGPAELASLAEQVARHTAGPVAADLQRKLDELQREFTQRLHATMREVMDESVLGPPLANFTGYLTIELGRESEKDPHIVPAGSVIRVAPGRRLDLVVSVVRDARAATVSSLDAGPDGSFLVLEPVIIEGGRNVAVAEFDAVADCATLTPLPRHKNLQVAGNARSSFSFKLPEQGGKHEVWFQLYQAGRLLQVIALAVEIRSEQVTAK